jgi:biotin carboxylase
MKKIAIIGASYLQVPLVIKAKEMGVETHCFAWKDGAVCEDIADFFYPISILNKEDILKKCLEIKIDGITTIATDLATPTISYVAEYMNLIANSYQTAINSTNKWQMRNVFKTHNCSIPDFFIVDKLSSINVDQLSFPLIVKPIDSSGSRGVSKVSNIKEFNKAVKYAINESISQKAIIEEYIDGCEVSVESISWYGKHTIIAITDKITTGPPHFVELEHHQPSKLGPLIQEKIKIETLNALNALNVQYGASHTEIKISSNNTPYLIEVGARMGGDFIGSHLTSLSTGYDYLKGVIEVALNTFTQPLLESNNFAGIYFLSKDSERILPFFNDDNMFWVEKKMISPIKSRVKNSNERSGYLIYQNNSKIII